MKRWRIPFNTYYLLLTLGLLAAGCKSDASKPKPGKEAASIRFHLQVNWNRTDRTETIAVYRAHPVNLNIDKIAALDEGHIAKAEVVDDPFGGFAIKIQFNRQGTWLLENLTVANKGGRFAILCVTDQPRWIAAPYIDRRYGDGEFTFTPDATREEAQLMVKGMNNLATKLNKKDF
jgi:hypothetical protein